MFNQTYFMHAKSIFVKISEEHFNQPLNGAKNLAMMRLRQARDRSLQSNALSELTKRFFVYTAMEILMKLES